MSQPEFESTPDPLIQMNELIERFGTEGLRQRQLIANRMLRQAGAHYTRSVGKRNSQIKDWALDPIPVVISAQSWKRIEFGISQRTDLLNKIYKDIYSDQKLIKEGVIPASLIYMNSGYLRALGNQNSKEIGNIILSASDLIESEKNEFCVVSDRIQAPSGLGYALQNRRVTSQLYSEPLFQERTSKLYAIFNSLTNSLKALTGKENPRAVILTPGSLSETFYEQKLLASYLGLSIVEGRDLTVSNGRVWFQSTEGEEAIDVIIRRVDQDWCDPVELRGESLLGVPGLVEVIRQGGVILANPLGTGVLESPALLKYLPAISQFFGEDQLSLRSVETLWGAEDLEQTLDQLAEMIIKPFQRDGRNSGSIYGPELSDKQLDTLRSKIKKSPEQFVAQEIIHSIQRASWQKGDLVKRGSITRTYSVFDENYYQVMRGGFTRSEVSSSRGIFTNQLGAINKDTWIVGTSVTDEYKLDLALTSGHAPKPGHEIRLNENLFWIARYLVRSETLLSSLDTLIQSVSEQSLDAYQAHSLLSLINKQADDTLDDLVLQFQDLPLTNDAIYRLLQVAELGSIQGTLQSVLFASESIFDQWSGSIQRTLNTVQEILIQLNQESYLPNEYRELALMISHLQSLVRSLQSAIPETGSHETAKQLYQVGTEIEKAQQIIIKLQHLITHPLDTPLFSNLMLFDQNLFGSDLFGQFTQQYQTIGEVLELLAGDHRSPDSLAHVIDSLNQALLNLDREHQSSLLPSYREPVLEMVQDLQEIRFDESSEQQTTKSWIERFQRWEKMLNKIASEIEQSYCGEKLTPRIFSPRTSLR